jgi:hypothetical protein
MKTSKKNNSNVLVLEHSRTAHKVVSTGLPAMDSHLGGGLGINQVTELVGPVYMAHLLAQSCISSAQRQGLPVAVIDYVHELALSRCSLEAAEVVQPDMVAALPGLVTRFARSGIKLAVAFLGDSVFFDHGIPRSPADRNLSRALRQLQWATASSGLACLLISDRPIMPDGATVVRAFGIKPETGEIFLKVTPAIEHRTAAVG